MKLYKKTTYKIAKDILNTITKKTGLYATAGIGPNMLLAKIAMDIEAKHNVDMIAEWTYDDVKSKLWSITPLSDMWGIGSRMEKKLNLLGINTIGDLANFNKYKLKEKFGIIGEELWYHANGIDLSKISDFNKEVKEKSISNSQILYKDYYNEDIYLIIKEIISVLVKRLRKENYLTSRLSIGIGYSKSIGGGFHTSKKIENGTNDEEFIYKNIINMFDANYETNTPIRKVGISLSKLEKSTSIQLNLFDKVETLNNKNKINKTIDNITNKYGNNSVLKATSLLNNSTIKSRNNKIGGHNAR